MPLMKGRDAKTVSSNIKEMVKAGHKPKQAIAAALSMKRKSKMMSEGGAVEGDYDLDEEHERTMEELMIQGDQPAVANPQTHDEAMSLAMRLSNEREMEEYAMGGLVQDGPAGDEPVGNKPSEDMSSHAEDMQLSDAAMMAIAEKKRKRKFMK